MNNFLTPDDVINIFKKAEEEDTVKNVFKLQKNKNNNNTINMGEVIRMNMLDL